MLLSHGKIAAACDECEIEEVNYIHVLEAINEFLPAKELAGRPIEISVLKQFRTRRE